MKKAFRELLLKEEYCAIDIFFFYTLFTTSVPLAEAQSNVWISMLVFVLYFCFLGLLFGSIKQLLQSLTK